MLRRLRLPLLLMLAALALPSAAAAAPNQWMTFEAPNELLDDGQREQALDDISSFGIDRVRALVYWTSVAPTPDDRTRPQFDATDPAAYPPGAWDRLDRLFDSAARRGIEIHLTLTGPVPRWATKGARDHVTEPSPQEFQAFTTAVARRYGERVRIWSVWNEPNHPQFLAPQFRRGRPASPRIYRRLFQAARAGLAAAGQGDDIVLFGETAPRGNARLVAPLAFLRGALCLTASYRKGGKCAPLDVDGYAHHAYTTAAGPRFRPRNRDDVTIGVLTRLTHALDRAARAGAIPPKLGIFLTEFGIQSFPDRIAGVSLARQAEYLAIAEHMAFSNPRVRSFSQYLLRDDKPRRGPPAERYGGFESGLRASDGDPKPAYDAFRLPLAAQAYGRSDVLWGLVRPQRTRTTVELLVADRSGGWRKLADVQTNDTGVFGYKAPHRGGRRYRVRWIAPDGTTFLGRPVRAY